MRLLKKRLNAMIWKRIHLKYILTVLSYLTNYNKYKQF